MCCRIFVTTSALTARWHPRRLWSTSHVRCALELAPFSVLRVKEAAEARSLSLSAPRTTASTATPSDRRRDRCRCARHLFATPPSTTRVTVRSVAMTTQASSANRRRMAPTTIIRSDTVIASPNNGDSGCELLQSPQRMDVARAAKAITSPHQRPPRHRRRRRHSIATTSYRTAASAVMDVSTAVATAPIATAETVDPQQKASSPAIATSVVAPMPRKSVVRVPRRTSSFPAALSAMSLRGPTAVSTTAPTASTASTSALLSKQLQLQSGSSSAEPTVDSSDAFPVSEQCSALVSTSPTSPPRVRVLEKQQSVPAATAAIHSGRSHRQRNSTTAATNAELPILRHQYIARDVRVLLGPRWKLRTFETRTIVLRTSSVDTNASVVQPTQPTLTLCATAPGAADAMTLVLPLSLTCDHAGSSELKLKLKHTRKRVGAADSARATTLRLRIRFATPADAAIWRQLLRDALAHAHWTHHVDFVARLASRGAAAATVLLVRDRELQSEYVVKTLPNARVDDVATTAELRVLRMIVASPLAAAAMPYVRSYRVVETPHDTQIVMPKLPGRTLLAFLQCQQSESPQRQSLGECDARVVLRQLCNALQALHAAGVVHCDLTLENILVTDALDVYVIDFGGAYDLATTADADGVSVSRATSHNTRRRHPTATAATATVLTSQQHRMVGTPGYIAPERIRYVDKPPTPAADVFSVGIVLFQMLTGRQPFARASRRHALSIEDTTTLDWSVAQQVLKHHGVSPTAVDLLAQMVEPDPNTRISVEQILAHEWLY